MKIHLIRKESLEFFVRKNAQSRQVLAEWVNKVKYSDWSNPHDIIDTFPTTDFLGNGSSRVVFDVGGNKYRLIAKFAFGDKQVHLFVCWIGTHAEYTKLCRSNEQYLVNMF